ncbi:MAG: gamma-glutamyl-gamma-aminobutyrate hydrolase family protein [Alphaproteobacteria bacterium]
MKKPVIGINLDFEEKGGEYIARPYHALSEKYFAAICKNGGTPIALPSTNMDVEAVLNLVDGIFLSGGNDYDPRLFGQEAPAELNLKIMHQRSQFDLLLAEKALDRDMPVLGICAGMQAINCLKGGNLFLDIPTYRPNSLNHSQRPEDMHLPSHDLSITPHTKLWEIIGKQETIQVNSRHHQALDRIGDGLVVSATAPDGIVEAIELPTHKFCIGVEWHAEFEISEADTRLLKAFIDACRN